MGELQTFASEMVCGDWRRTLSCLHLTFVYKNFDACDCWKDDKTAWLAAGEAGEVLESVSVFCEVHCLCLCGCVRVRSGTSQRRGVRWRWRGGLR